MVTWKPDFCPTGRCVIELHKVGGTPRWLLPKSIISLCQHHQNVKNTFGLTDNQIFRVLRVSSRRKERARWETKLQLGLDKEQVIPFIRHAALLQMQAEGNPPTPPYCLGNPDNIGFRIVSGLSGALLTALQTRITDALLSEDSETGIGTITVE